MLALSDLNGMAILVAAVVSAGLGALWYSPILFGPAWMKALGKTQDQLGSPGASIAASVVSCLVAASAMEILVVVTGVGSLGGGIALGALVGFGVVAMTMLSDALFSGWGWPLYIIQTGYRASYLVIMGAICGAWA